MTFCKMTFSKMTFSIMSLDTNAVMLSVFHAVTVASNPFLLSFIMLSVIMLNVVMPSVIMLNVVAPFFRLEYKSECFEALLKKAALA